MKAAGILLQSVAGNVLFLKRGPGGDYPGAWCFPGGRLEEGEDALTAAIRETEEEAVFKADPKQLKEITRSITPTADGSGEVDFTTFLLKKVKEFAPDLAACGEHVAYAWAPAEAPPEPLHPGCAIALRKLQGMDELQTAEAIRDGLLTSPQRYENISLFAMRITGTGVAMRGERKDEAGKVTQKKEYVFRNKDLYLNEEFLRRCSGLPVILEHPKGDMLDSEEFSERIVGTILLPYIVGEEVWGVAKIYDDATAKMMAENQMSTSPAVVWRGIDNNTVMKTEDGVDVLIEGKPTLLDHLAICWQGVWDKGGEPAGIISRKDDDMSDKENDALLKIVTAIGEKLETVNARFDSIQKRFDAEDEKEVATKKADAAARCDEFNFSERKDSDSDEDVKERRDAEEKKLAADMEEAGMPRETAQDKAKKRRDSADEEDKKKMDSKKDADEDEDKKKSAADAAALAASNEELRKQIAELSARVEKGLTVRNDADTAAFGKFQARADAVYSALGGSAPVPHAGESLMLYRKRIAGDLKKHSPRFKDVEFSVVAADEAAFNAMENVLLDEVAAIARSDSSVPEGELREISKMLPTGHRATEFRGNPAVWMGRHNGGKRFAEILLNGKK